MDISFGELVFLGVVLSRLLVPLLIIRFPLPAIVACLVIDAVDQTVFQAIAPDADLSGYQSYDKALDIYYLVIAYIATLRNWTNQFAVEMARFLIFYRLVGVVLFELSEVRGILFIFPNTFEYFFIFYESVRLFWDPRRMSRRVIIGATAFIWIFIKLPQEWWIHIAQLDTTDLVQETIFGVPAGTPWLETFAARPWIVVLAVVAAAAAAYAVYWLMKHKLPPRDRPLTIDADAEPGRAVPPERLAAVRSRLMRRVLGTSLLEKYALIALVSIIFGQMLQVQAESWSWRCSSASWSWPTPLSARGWSATASGPDRRFRQFIVTGLLNVGIVAVMLLFDLLGDSTDPGRLTFFVLLVTLLVTLYDRYRPEYLARFDRSDSAPTVGA